MSNEPSALGRRRNRRCREGSGFQQRQRLAAGPRVRQELHKSQGSWPRIEHFGVSAEENTHPEGSLMNIDGQQGFNSVDESFHQIII